MKIGNNIIRLLKATLEQRNLVAMQADAKANEAATAAHFKKHAKLLSAAREASQKLVSANRELEAVGICNYYDKPALKSFTNAGLHYTQTPRVKVERVLAELAGADEKDGKSILAKYGVKI